MTAATAVVVVLSVPGSTFFLAAMIYRCSKHLKAVSHPSA